MRVLADTAGWIEHLRQGEPLLTNMLSEGMVLMHPFVSGELACGTLRNRTAILFHLSALPAAKEASTAEAFGLIEDQKPWGRGLGWIDVHLLASARLSHCPLWTLDKRLVEAARHLQVSFAP